MEEEAEEEEEVEEEAEEEEAKEEEQTVDKGPAAFVGWCLI